VNLVFMHQHGARGGRGFNVVNAVDAVENEARHSRIVGHPPTPYPPSLKNGVPPCSLIEPSINSHTNLENPVPARYPHA
jgi:hypothetical protein